MQRTWKRSGARRTALAAIAVVAALTAPAPAPAATSSPHAADVHRDARLNPRADGARWSRGSQIGEVRAWPAYSALRGEVYIKNFRLRAVGTHVELWTPVGDEVSTGLDYAAGDCRNGERTRVTQEQLEYLADQYDRVIFPRQIALVGAPARRDGTNATLAESVDDMPPDVYRSPQNRTVVLVDNLRDIAFPSPGRGQGALGLVTLAQIELTDRNVINLAGIDWAWRLGPDPRPTVASGDACTAVERQVNHVEIVLAHENMHLIHGGAGENMEGLRNDPTWLIEGLAVWGSYRSGYDSTAARAFEDGRAACFFGHRPGCGGGPQTSLSRFREPGNSTTASYGAAGTFLATLEARYGESLMRDLTRTVGTWGAEKLDHLLARRHADDSFDRLVADWAAAMSLDGVLDDGAVMTGAERFQVPALHASIAFDSPFAFHRPGSEQGAPPNGSGFIRLRDAMARPLRADQIAELAFDGAEQVSSAWTVDPEGHGPSNPALFSGVGDNNDRAIAMDVEVPATGPGQLSFSTRYEIERGYDFAFVQVSEDGGRTWSSLPTQNTTTEHAADASDLIVAGLPGLTGDSGGWIEQQVDLSAFRGRRVAIAFRLRTDWAWMERGFWVDDVAIDGRTLSDGSTLAGWRDLAPAVKGMSLRLISYTGDHAVAKVSDIPLGAGNDARLDRAALQAAIAPGADTVAAIVTHHAPDLLVAQCVGELLPNGRPDQSWYARYSLSVNGVEQDPQ